MTVASDEVKRERVREAIEADPTISNRAVAKALGIGRDTVNDVRRTMNGGPAMVQQSGGGAVIALPVVPASLDVNHARLPAAYESAVVALTKATEIDECHEWANKADALASYARQAKDERLHKMAKRIQARAMRRCGELLAKVKPGVGGRPSETRTGDDTSFSRESVAHDAGMSKRQKDTALRVAAVPKADFEQQVESDAPPTVTALAEQGKGKVSTTRGPVQKRSGRTINVERLCAEVDRVAGFCRANRNVGDAVAAMCHPVMIATLRQQVAEIDSWLDAIMVNLPDGTA